jgi:hypothetical protein
MERLGEGRSGEGLSWLRREAPSAGRGRKAFGWRKKEQGRLEERR